MPKSSSWTLLAKHISQPRAMIVGVISQLKRKPRDGSEYNENIMSIEILPSLDIDTKLSRRRVLTARLRERWTRSAQPVVRESSFSLTPSRLPLHIIRQKIGTLRDVRSVPGKNWMSSTEKKKLQEKRTEFDSKWKNEVLKRNAEFQTRLPYARMVNPPTPMIRQHTWCSNVDEQPFFYNSYQERPKSLKERERKTRHFVHPEWKSENVSWVRFDERGVKEIDRLSLF